MNEHESDGDRLRRLGTDAVLWAKDFLETAHRVARSNGFTFADLIDDPSPGDFLHVWFVNAIEAGRSAGYAQAKREHDPDWPT